MQPPPLPFGEEEPLIPQFVAMPGYSATPQSPPEPPATGTVSQAWRSIGTNMDRRNIAAWAQSSTSRWTRNSLIASAVLIAVTGLLSWIIRVLEDVPFVQQIQAPGNMTILLEGTLRVIIRNFIFGPIELIVGLVALAFGLALFMPQYLGPLRGRFQHVFPLLALAQVPLQVVLFMSSMIIGVSRINSTLEESIQILLSLLIAVYGTVLSLQVGSVASNQPRWTVFIISLGVGLIVLLVFKLLTAPLSPFGLAFY